MSIRRIINYKDIIEGTDNSFISKELNHDFLNEIKPFLSSISSIVCDFGEKYNLKYFGELIERFQERGIAKSIEDLRTLTLVAGCEVLVGKADHNTNQTDLFAKQVVERLKSEFDLLTATFLMLTLKECMKEEDKTFLANEIISFLKNNNNLSFEKQIYSMFSVLYSNRYYYKECINEEIKDEIISLFHNKIKPKNLDTICNYQTYIMLSKMLNDLDILSNTKLFKDKASVKFYKSLISLGKKEYKQSNVKTTKANLNMDYSDIIFYNYVISEATTFTEIPCKITSKGKVRLISELLSYLEKDEKCPTIISDIISKNIGNHASWHSPLKIAIDNIFSQCCYKVSRNNFDLFLNLTKLDSTTSVYRFITCDRFKYLCSEEYYDLFLKIHPVNRKYLLNAVILECEDEVKLNSIYNNLLTLNEVESSSIYDDSSTLNIEDENRDKLSLNKLDDDCIIKFFKFKIINPKDLKVLIDTNLLNCALSFWSKELDNTGFIEIINYCYEKIYEIASLEFGSIYDKDKFIYSSFKLLFRAINNFNIESITDLNIAREFYKTRDNLSLAVYKNREKYYMYLLENLTNTHYLKVFSISEVDKINICKSIYINIKTYVSHVMDNDIYYPNLNRLKKLLATFEDIVLTEDEKNQIIEQQELLKEDAILEETRGSKYLDEFRRIVSATQSKTVLSKIKDIFIDKITKKDISLTYQTVDVFRIMKHLAKSDVISDNEILEITKSIMDAQ